MKRSVRMMAGIIFLFLFLIPNQALAAGQPPHVSAQAATLIDVNSGRILYEKNGDEPKPIASITKIMTAIIAIEHGNLEEKVTVSSKAAGKEGSSLYLKQGEKMTLQHLLYGLMLRSGNDAAVAIAEHIAGSEEGFAILMNEKATYLGMANSHFVNPHGLDDERHYSTANDMAKLAVYALKNKVFQNIVDTSVIQVPHPKENWNLKWYNKNKMLHMYTGADGVKTGYTSKAKRTLVSSATRNAQQLVVVTLNAPDDWNDSMALMDYGFQKYPLRTVLDENEVIDQKVDEQGMVIAPEHPFIYPLTAQEFAEIEKDIHIPGELPAGLKTGIPVGEVDIKLAGKTIGSVPLVTKKANTLSDATPLFEHWFALLSPVWSEARP